MTYEPDKNRVKLLVDLYQQKIFALALYLIGGDKNKVYDIAASSFAEAFRSSSPIELHNAFLTRVVRAVIEKCRTVKIIPSFDDSDFKDLPPEKQSSLRMVRAALQKVPFDEKIFILMRDQLHLPYGDISGVLGISEKDARIGTTQARVRLRKELEEVIAHGE